MPESTATVPQSATGLACSTTPAPVQHPIVFDTALAEQDPAAAAKVWSGAVQAFARRLGPRERSEFLMSLDGMLYDYQGEAAIAAGLHGGLHPKHALTRYHDFFVENIRAGETVIDLGCGVGALAASIAQRSSASVTGMDWTLGNLTKARAAAAALGLEHLLTFVEGDITTKRLEGPVGGKFDVVVLSNVLEHITNREQRLSVWRSWYRPSKFLIRVPAFDRDWRVPWKKELGVEWRLDPTHETEYTAEQLRKELKAAGLEMASLTVRWGEYWAVATPGTR